MESREALGASIIKVIYATPYQGMTVEQIVEATSVDKTTIQEQLEILEDQGEVKLLKSDQGIVDAELTVKRKAVCCGRATGISSHHCL